MDNGLRRNSFLNLGPIELNIRAVLASLPDAFNRIVIAENNVEIGSVAGFKKNCRTIKVEANKVSALCSSCRPFVGTPITTSSLVTGIC